MTNGDRVKEIRVALGLSLEKFGEKVGVSRAAISNIEKGNRSLTEQMKKSICREFNVDYFWLTEGKGEMFLETSDDVIDQVVSEYGLDDLDKVIIKAYVETNDEGRRIIKEYLKKVAEQIKKSE